MNSSKGDLKRSGKKGKMESQKWKVRNDYRRVGRLTYVRGEGGWGATRLTAKGKTDHCHEGRGGGAL